MTKDELLTELKHTTKLLEKIKSEIDKTEGMNYLTVKQVSKKTNVCPSSIYGWLYSENDALPFFRMGRVRGIRIREDELENWLEKFKIYPRQRIKRLINI